jgi:TonB-dependent starch-binding outer membrane protein SusC
MKQICFFEKKSPGRAYKRRTLSVIELIIILILVTAFTANGKTGYSGSEKNHERKAPLVSDDRSSVNNTTDDILQARVSGTVTDVKGNPLIGVTVLVKGSTIGSLTDASGKYSLVNVPQNATLVFSFVGMSTQEIPASGKTVIDVVLKEEAIGLDEVVVIGYGSQRKVTLTGSVASVTNKEIVNSPTTNISNSIAGLLPGVIALNRTGEPGRDDATVLIRGMSTTGSTSPLVVVDGIQGVSGWQRINSNDIESISILKDASASIYGARAANGVILITTKRGMVGKPMITYSYNQGISQPTRLPELADAPTFAQYVNDLLVRQGQSPRYTDAEIQKFANGSDPLNYPNVNWYKEVLKKSTLQSQHNISLRGGSETIKYSVSGSYSNENGIFKNGVLNFKNYAIRANLDAMVNKYLKVGVDLNSSMQNGNYAQSNFDGLRQLPFIPVYYPNGLPSAGIEGGANPAIMATSAWGNNNNRIDRNVIKTSFDLAIPWVNGLNIDGYYAFNKDETVGKLWQKPFTVYNYDKISDTYIPVTGGGILYPQLTQSLSIGRSTLYNLRIRYEKNIDNHHLSTFIAAEQSNYRVSSFSAFRKNYLSSTIDEIFAGSLTDQQTTGTSSESGRKNLFGRVSYGYAEKYLLDFNFRYDGSSNFPKGKQWGFFPGASIAWRISQENFIKNNLSFITNLKLRASYGQIGNDAIAAFQNLRLYTLNSQGYTYGTTQAATQGLVAGVSPNPNITWEVAKTSNVGMDASLWNGLLGWEIDFFKQKRSNILATRDLAVPSYAGLTLPTENIGVVENKGFELQLSHMKTFNDLTYRIAGNIAYSRSKIIYMSEAQNVPEWQKAEGHMLGADLMYKAIGIFRTQADVDASPKWTGTIVGDLKYEDINGNGLIDAGDRVRTDKSNIPQMTFGLNFSVNYKRFALWANFTGAARVWQYYLLECRLAINNLAEVIENRYRVGSMDSKYPWLPTLGTESEVSGLHSTFWMRNASYARLKTLELSYTLPENLLSKVKISSMRVFVNGNNLFTIDKLKWVDPENSNQSAAFYPQSKIYNLGVNVSF